MLEVIFNNKNYRNLIVNLMFSLTVFLLIKFFLNIIRLMSMSEIKLVEILIKINCDIRL